MKTALFIVVLTSLLPSSFIYAQDTSFTQEDRERLIRLEVTLQEFKEDTDKRFEQFDQRFEELRKDTNKRFEELREDMNKRFEQVDKRFEQMMTFLLIIAGIFTTLTLGVIGFAFWDRRTVIRKAKEVTIEEVEKEGRLKDLINALRELSKTDPKLETVLRNFHLL